MVVQIQSGEISEGSDEGFLSCPVGTELWKVCLPGFSLMLLLCSHPSPFLPLKSKPLLNLPQEKALSSPLPFPYNSLTLSSKHRL